MESGPAGDRIDSGGTGGSGNRNDDPLRVTGHRRGGGSVEPVVEERGQILSRDLRGERDEVGGGGGLPAVGRYPVPLDLLEGGVTDLLPQGEEHQRAAAVDVRIEQGEDFAAGRVCHRAEEGAVEVA